MRKKTLALGCAAWGLTSCLWIQAQDISQQFISARSGMVNYTDGSPRVYRGLKDWMPLSVKDQLRAGDRVQVGDSERVELLLNPGSYLRLASQAELRVFRTSFDDTRFGLSRGVAIIESSVFNKKLHALTMTTPAGDVRILESGLYRFEVKSPQEIYVSVMKGQAKWVQNDKEIATLKSGKRFNLAESSERKLQYSKLDKNQMDDIDLWSQRRAEFLVAANSRMSYWGTQTAYMNYGYLPWGGWAFNPFYNCYTFVPFDGFFMSPYGFMYRNFFPIYGPYYGGYGGGGRSGGNANGSNPSRSTTVQSRTSASSAPAAPSTRMDSGRSDTGSRSSAHSSIRH